MTFIAARRFARLFSTQLRAPKMAAAEGWKQGGDRIGIPAPSGPHKVGCVDLMHRFPGEKDGHLVRLFYPSEGGAGYQYISSIPDKKYIKALLKCVGSVFPEFNVNIQPSSGTPREEKELPAVLCPGLAEAPLLRGSAALSGQGYPVIVYSHGLTSMRTDYSGICCDLASHGNIVASVEHRDRSACLSLRRVPKLGGAPGELQDDWLEYYVKKETEKEFPLRNQQVKQRAAEVGKSLDLLGLLNERADVQNMMDVKFDFGQFRGRIDLSTAAVMGHSFGGATTIQALLSDQRFKCGIALDCWMVPIHQEVYESGIAKPLLFVNSYHFQWEQNVQRMLRLVKKPDTNGVSTCHLLTLRNSNHFSQTDLYFVSRRSSKLLANLWPRTDPTIPHAVNMEICHSFLKRFLQQDPNYQRRIPILDGGEEHSDHVVFGTNLDLGGSPNSTGAGQAKL